MILAIILILILILTMIAGFWYECATWPRAEDDPTNKIDWDKP